MINHSVLDDLLDEAKPLGLAIIVQKHSDNIHWQAIVYSTNSEDLISRVFYDKDLDNLLHRIVLPVKRSDGKLVYI